MATHSSTLCLENSMDGGAWWATVHGVTKSQTQLSDFTMTKQKEEIEQEEMIVLGKTNKECKSNVNKEYQLKKNMVNSLFTC